MSPFARLGVALLLIWSGAMLWAYGLALPGTGDSYWQRDLRWSAVVAVCATFVWLCRGRRPYLWFAVGALVAWLGVDIWLDRAGTLSWGTAAISAAVVASIAGGLLARGRGDGGEKTLTGTAAICALTAPAVLPTAAGGAPGIRLLLSALLVVVAMTCALSASPAGFRTRLAAWGITFLWYAGAATGLFRGVLLLFAAGILLAGVWLATRELPGPRRAVSGVLAIMASLPVLGYLLFLASWQLGRPLTALAGRQQIPGATADVVVPLTTALVALTYAVYWAVPWRQVFNRNRKLAV